MMFQWVQTHRLPRNNLLPSHSSVLLYHSHSVRNHHLLHPLTFRTSWSSSLILSIGLHLKSGLEKYARLCCVLKITKSMLRLKSLIALAAWRHQELSDAKNAWCIHRRWQCHRRLRHLHHLRKPDLEGWRKRKHHWLNKDSITSLLQAHDF